VELALLFKKSCVLASLVVEQSWNSVGDAFAPESAFSGKEDRSKGIPNVLSNLQNVPALPDATSGRLDSW
jgi:hypothetical protein